MVYEMDLSEQKQSTEICINFFKIFPVICNLQNIQTIRITNVMLNPINASLSFL